MQFVRAVPGARSRLCRAGRRGDGADGRQGSAKAERAAGVPLLVPGMDGVARLPRSVAGRAGFPVAQGGRWWWQGDAARHDPAELDTAFQNASAEAQAAFGNGDLYLEQAVVPARHVEVQVLCDHQGGVLTLGERECSIQRRHQKLVEESPSPALDPELRDAMEAAAERACRAIGYANAGTFEFLLGPDGSFSFIELNARLQVEHPVTELCTGIDIVREQLRIAAGEPLTVTGRAPRSGHAIEVRINAEDPRRDFAAAAGTITRFRPPLGTGVRVDTAVIEGAAIPPFYDSMIAKVIVHDESRDAAIARAIRALGELEVEGIPTLPRRPGADARGGRLVSHVIERPGGSITISDAALHQVVAGAVGLVPGARPRRRRGSRGRGQGRPGPCRARAGGPARRRPARAGPRRPDERHRGARGHVRARGRRRRRHGRGSWSA